MTQIHSNKSVTVDASRSSVPVRFVRQGMRFSERWAEFLGALLMSLAALVSAWCAYQAAWWASEQSEYTIEMSRAQGRAAAFSNSAIQLTAFDASMFIQYAEAVSTGNSRLSQFLHERFRPEMRVAVDAWLATQPLTNPDAPSSPIAMPEYALSQVEQAESFSARAAAAQENALQSNDRSTQFIAFTTMSAAALFLGGITTKFPTLRIRTGLLIFAWGVLLATIGYTLAYSLTLEPLRPIV